ncbi:MAG: hypothetical protein ACYCST_11165 [Acidimicrobiales bacterium]
MTTRPGPLNKQSIAALLDIIDCPPLSGGVIAPTEGSKSFRAEHRYLVAGAHIYSSCPHCLYPFAPLKVSESFSVDPTSLRVEEPILLCTACEYPIEIVASTLNLDAALTPEGMGAVACGLLEHLMSARDAQTAILAERLQHVAEIALRLSVSAPRAFVDFVISATDDEVLPVPIFSTDIFGGVAIDGQTLALSLSALVPPPHYAGSDLAPCPETRTLYEKDVPAWQSDPVPLALVRREIARALGIRQ